MLSKYYIFDSAVSPILYLAEFKNQLDTHNLIEFPSHLSAVHVWCMGLIYAQLVLHFTVRHKIPASRGG